MKRKALFIGGTGTISSAITAQLAAEGEWELTLLNRGNRNGGLPENVHTIKADISDEAAVEKLLEGTQWDCVCDFIGFKVPQVERDWRLFRGRTKQYMYISSASAYQKPLASPYITEGTPLVNPYWQYSRDKIACEDFLMEKCRTEGFPVTVIRPSHTYDDRKVPVGVHGDIGSWQVLRRMLDGKPVIIQGDGTSLWTLTHNTDFAKGFIGLMGNPHALGNAFHITSDEVLTWNQIYQALAANTVLFDNAKLKRAVPGFQATVRYEQGIRQTVANILTHPELQVPDPAFDAWCDRVIAALEETKRAIRP